ncbi:MAG: hypothetical protein EOM20_09840 [Spartobacteria bacterium]|nr:hypothetical protein [Spartobacteria bacterium]
MMVLQHLKFVSPIPLGGSLSSMTSVCRGALVPKAIFPMIGKITCHSDSDMIETTPYDLCAENVSFISLSPMRAAPTTQEVGSQKGAEGSKTKKYSNE